MTVDGLVHAELEVQVQVGRKCNRFYETAIYRQDLPARHKIDFLNGSPTQGEHIRHARGLPGRSS
jgi:hypothetical protein